MFRASAIGLSFAALFSIAAFAGSRDFGYSRVYSFPEGGDAQTPFSLISDIEGNLYGVALGGQNQFYCGSIFKIGLDGARTTLYFFKGGPDDVCGATGIAFDRQGAIYGISGGGLDGLGGVFRLSKNGHEKILAKFDRDIGIIPFNRPLMGHDGNLYGTLAQGGDGTQAGPGSVFKVTPEGQISVVHAFDGHLEGCNPRGGLVQDKAGMLYGATDTCGATGQGVIYKIDPTTGVETVLHAFSGASDGAHAISTLTMDDAGNLYGGTFRGGTLGGVCDNVGCGIIFKMMASGKYKVMYRFKNYADGVGVSGPLFRDRYGDILGTTRLGGDPNCGCGTIFKLTDHGRTKITEHVFLGAAQGDGAYPIGLVAARHRAGTQFIYGTTDTGGDCTDDKGNGCGIIYKVEKY